MIFETGEWKNLKHGRIFYVFFYVGSVTVFIDRFRWKEYNITMIIQDLANPGKPGDAKLQGLASGSQLHV